MNILMVIRWPVGGIQTYCKYIYSSTAFQSCSFTVITTQDVEEQYFTNAFGSKLQGLFRLTDSQFSASTILRIGRQIPRVDLVHAHGFSSAILASPTRVLLGAPLLLTSHDIVQDAQFRGIAGCVKRVALGSAIMLSTCVNVVGTDAGENLRSYFPWACSAKRMSVIQNGIDVQQFADPRRRDLRGELGLGKATLLLGFFGRFMAQKGFKYILDMLEKHGDLLEAPVHVVCFGWGGFIREEQAEIVRRGLSKHFSFLPATNEMPAALRGCDAVLMPSLWEAMPLLAMEALVAGVPLLASSCIGLREVCVGTPALTFAPADSRSLLDAVNGFVSQRAIHEAEARRYQSEAVERFDRKETASRLRALYDTIVRRGVRVPSKASAGRGRREG